MNRASATTAAALIFSTLLVAGSALAHGKAEHVMGTVQKISDDSLTVQTTKGDFVVVTLATTTRYLKSGEPSTLKELKVGERVAIDTDVHGGHPIASTVKFGAPQKMQH
jgi:riboflavin synthase alpha subunit